MSTRILRATVKPEHVADLEAAVGKLFAALDEYRPEGLRYASARVDGTRDYVVLLQLDDGLENPLPTYPEFLAFQAGLGTWVESAPTPEVLSVVGSYRLF
ncbi:MAG: hypothetical protein J7518_21250 [Nocardioidaceae bacterium]|nr:hypothetical protein [Nocardioidaceae bacterium]